MAVPHSVATEPNTEPNSEPLSWLKIRYASCPTVTSQAPLPIITRTAAGSLSAWAWIRMTRNTGVAYAARVTVAGQPAARRRLSWRRLNYSRWSTVDHVFRLLRSMLLNRDHTTARPFQQTYKFASSCIKWGWWRISSAPPARRPPGAFLHEARFAESWQVRGVKSLLPAEM